MTKTDLAKADPKNTALAVPDDIDLFGDAGMGNENVTQDDVIIPRLKIIQSMSPELKKSKPEFIEGAEEGGVFNSATRALVSLPLLMIPVAYQRRYIEWVPREKGGGLVNPDHNESILEKCVRTDNGSLVLENGNEIVDTPEHFVIYLDGDGVPQQAVMSMASTQAKVSRQWNTLIRNLQIKNPQTGKMVNPARFYGSYRFNTVPESNDRGDWMNWKLEYAGPTVAIPEVGADLYRMCRDFHKLINDGKVKAEVDQPQTAGEGAKTTEAF